MKDKSINELFKMSQEGNKQARDYLVEMNMKLVYKIANSYRNSDKLDFDTAVQEGSIGLIKAIDKFEVDRGLQFSTYAVWRIRGEMQRFMRDLKEDRPYRPKRSDFETYRKIFQARNRLSQEFHGEPTNREVATYLGMEQLEVERVIGVMENRTSIYSTKYYNKDGKDDILIYESIEDQDNISEEQLINKMIIREAMKKLDEKQKKIIELRYINDLTQVQVGKILNVTQVHVSRIERKALKLLKKAI